MAFAATRFAPNIEATLTAAPGNCMAQCRKQFLIESHDEISQRWLSVRRNIEE
jgi:hypothetical protein